MLLTLDDILPILRCPKTGKKLKYTDDTLLQEEKGFTYSVIDNYPVLVDFKNSVIDKDSTEVLASKKERPEYSGLTGIAKKLVSPPNPITSHNVESLISTLQLKKGKTRVLIVGGGAIGHGMQPLYNDPNIDLVSFDIYASENVQFIADGHNIPLVGNHFDAVVVQAVLEHVLEPTKVVSEIYRVLKDDGIVYAETPFIQHVHEAAYDFTRYTESGHRYLFKHFSLIDSGVVSGAGTQLLWSLDLFFQGLFRSRKAGKVVKLFFFWLFYCDKLIPDPYNIDAASGVYFMGKKSADVVTQHDIIAHYKGAQ